MTSKTRAEQFGDQLSLHIEQLGISNTEMAKRAGVSRQQIYRWRKGKCLPGFETGRVLFQFFMRNNLKPSMLIALWVLALEKRMCRQYGWKRKVQRPATCDSPASGFRLPLKELTGDMQWI